MSGLRPPSATLLLRVGQAVVAVSSSDAELQRWLSVTLADLEVASPTAPHGKLEPDYSVEIVIEAAETVWWVDGARRYSSANTSNVVDHLVSWCNRIAAESARAGVNLHAAGLVPPGGRGCVLIPGVPGAGKSSLAVAASAAGWGYLSDELCNVSFNDGGAVVGPYPKPITVKRGGLALVDLDWDELTISESQTRWYVRPSLLGGSIAAAAAPMAIVFSTFNESEPFSAQTLGASEALVELATHSLDVLDADGEALLTLARLCSQVHCVRLTRSATAEALAQIAQLSRSPVASSAAPVLVAGPPMPAECVGPRIATEAVTVSLHDGLVVYQPATHVVVALAGTAASIWPLLDGSAPADQLAEELAEAFSHPVEQVASDLDALLRQLTDQGLVSWPN